MSSTLMTYLVALTGPLAAAWLAGRMLHVGPSATRRQGGTGLVALDTREAFDSARWRHTRADLAAALTGRRQALHLPALPLPTAGRMLRPVGECLVPLCRIVGSVDAGRHPFDRRFDPTDDAAWARFSSVFAARSDGVDLPPVLLYRAGHGYYVLDGHHRVAVARALGDREIRADVTLLDG
jgi:hypothetical protein